jgi:uncharacterized membrane protein
MHSMNETSGRIPNPWLLSLAVLLPGVSGAAAYMGLHYILLIAFLVVGLSAFIVLLRGNCNFDDRIMMALVWSISLSLILASTFASDYIRGDDIHYEYLVATQTLVTGVWSTQSFNAYASVLSVAILPAMIGNLSALSMVQIFKFVYPVLFSLVPVILYKITRKVLAPGGAFLSVFLFMSYELFYDMSGLARQEIGEILLVLLLFVLLSPAISKSVAGRLSLILLMTGFAVSHYSLVYIFIVILAYSCLASRALRRTEAGMLLGLTLVAGLAWYTYAAAGVGMLALVKSISSVFGVLANGIFSSSSRPAEVMKAIGAAPISSGPLQQVNRWTQIVVQLCLVLGFFVLALKKKGTMEQKMFPLMTGGLIVLGCSIALPGVAATLNLDRIYHISLLFIAPFFIYGIELVELALRRVGSRVEIHRHTRLRTATRKNTLHLAAGILFFYFLFVSGWFTVVTAGTPTSFVLDANRMRYSTNPTVSEEYHDQFTVLPDIDGAVWLRFYDTGRRPVCADIKSLQHVLASYGEFSPLTGQLNYIPDECHSSDSFVYLSEFNNLYGLGYAFNGTFPISDISQRLSNMNRVYSNGRTAIYAEAVFQTALP